MECSFCEHPKAHKHSQTTSSVPEELIEELTAGDCWLGLSLAVRQQTGRWHRHQNKFGKPWEQTKVTARLTLSDFNYFNWI